MPLGNDIRHHSRAPFDILGQKLLLGYYVAGSNRADQDPVGEGRGIDEASCRLALLRPGHYLDLRRVELRADWNVAGGYDGPVHLGGLCLVGFFLKVVVDSPGCESCENDCNYRYDGHCVRPGHSASLLLVWDFGLNIIHTALLRCLLN